jgi:hypothetical protein
MYLDMVVLRSIHMHLLTLGSDVAVEQGLHGTTTSELMRQGSARAHT